MESWSRKNSWDSIVKVHMKIIVVSSRMVAEKMERIECKRDTVLAADETVFSDWHGANDKRGIKDNIKVLVQVCSNISQFYVPYRGLRRNSNERRYSFSLHLPSLYREQNTAHVCVEIYTHMNAHIHIKVHTYSMFKLSLMKQFLKIKPIKIECTFLIHRSSTLAGRGEV